METGCKQQHIIQCVIASVSNNTFKEVFDLQVTSLWEKLSTCKVILHEPRGSEKNGKFF